MHVKITLLMVAISISILFFPSLLLAGTCDCGSGINAKAIMSSACSAIINNNACILKESGVASQSSEEMGRWVQDVYRYLRTTPRSFYLFSDDPRSQMDFIERIYPRINDMRYFESYIIYTLAGEVPSRFAAGVIDATRNKAWIVKDAWSGSGERKESFSYYGMQVIITRHVFYAEKENIKFYINFRLAGPTPSLP